MERSRFVPYRARQFGPSSAFSRREGCTTSISPGRRRAPLETSRSRSSCQRRQGAGDCARPALPVFPRAHAGTLGRGVAREFGAGLDYLINNAGGDKARGDFLALPDSAWDDGYALNFFAQCARARVLAAPERAPRGALFASRNHGRKREKPSPPSGSSSTTPSPPSHNKVASGEPRRRSAWRVNCIHPSCRDRTAMAA